METRKLTCEEQAYKTKIAKQVERLKDGSFKSAIKAVLPYCSDWFEPYGTGFYPDGNGEKFLADISAEERGTYVFVVIKTGVAKLTYCTPIPAETIFIGFWRTNDPASEIRSALEKYGIIKRKPKKYKQMMLF